MAVGVTMLKLTAFVELKNVTDIMELRIVIIQVFTKQLRSVTDFLVVFKPLFNCVLVQATRPC